MTKPTRVDYCQYLLSTPINYTLTHFADHWETFSHDQINRYLAKDRLKPRHIWEEVKADVVQIPDGYIIFDDTILEKKHAEKIALARHQYSGNARKVVNGIGVVTCLYVNPTLDQSWLIDYRIYDKQGDGKTKLDPVEDMLGVLVEVRSVAFSTVLMDSWYASKRLLLYIESLKKTYYCPMKSNRLVDDSQGEKPYQRIDTLHSTVSEETIGKVVKLHKFPKHHKVKVFRVASSRRTDYVVTNDLSQSDVSATRQACSSRWKVERFHREAKQVTGLEKCQCRLARIVRNHIGAAFMVWVHLMRKAYETGQTLYQVKHGMLSEYLRQQLKSPMLKIKAA